MGIAVSAAAERRVSADERERMIARLQGACVDERVSLDTFAERLDRVYAARTHQELRAVVADLPQPGRVERWLSQLAEWAAACSSRCADAWATGKSPLLVLPTQGMVLLGRSRRCQCVIAEPTISRQHAILRATRDGWEVHDLGSTNGTYVNGKRITDAMAVRPGDSLSFGFTCFRLAEPHLTR